MTVRKAVAMVVALAVLAGVASLLIGAPEGKRLGYQILTARSPGLSWLLVFVLLAVTGVPLATFILREELYMWNKWKMRFEPYARDEHPVLWWLMLWVDLVLFLVIVAGLFIFSR